MTGGASFNEVFFTEVRVPDSHRLGDVNQGWTVALTTLMNERASIGAGGGGRRRARPTSRRLAEMCRHFGVIDDPIVRQKLMDVYINFQVAKYNNQRALDKIKQGQLPGPEMSIAKLSLTNNLWRTANFVADVLGPRAIADTGEWGTYAWSPAPAGRARHEGGRRHRRGHEEHRRRARAGPAQGHRHRLDHAVQGPQGRHPDELTRRADQAG